MKMKNFQDRVVYLVGGSSGIGLEAARLVAADGAHVLVLSRTESRLKTAVAAIKPCCRTSKQRVEYAIMDAADHQTVEACIDASVEKFGPPDIVINCAGRSVPHYFSDITHEMFDDTIRQNLYTVANVARAVVPYMKEKGGTIVNTSSIAGLMGVFGLTDYCAAKYGIVGFSEALRSELKPYENHNKGSINVGPQLKVYVSSAGNLL